MQSRSVGSATATAAGRTRLKAWLTAAVLLLLVSAGTFVAQSQHAFAAPGDFTVTPTTLDFGNVALGYGSGMSVDISNISATTQTPAFTGGAPSGIGFGVSDSCAGATLGPGESCDFHYYFQPNSAGVHTGTADIVIDGELFPITLTGNGVGVFPNTVAPTALDFGAVAVGDTSPPIDVVITNVTAAPEDPHVIGGFAPGNEFVRSNHCDGIVLDPGESCVVSYDFTPANVSVHNATAILNVHNGTFPITLTGTGVEAAPTSTTPFSDPGPTTGPPPCPTTEPTPPSTEPTSTLAVDSTTTTTGESTTTTSTSPGPIGPATVSPPSSTSSTSSSTSSTSPTTTTTLPITTTTVNPCAPPPTCETTTTATLVVTTPVSPTVATTPVITTTTTTSVPIPAETTTTSTAIASTTTSTTVPIPGDTRTTSTTIVIGVPTVTDGPATSAPRIVVAPPGRSRPVGTAQAVPCVSPSTLPPTSFGQLPATGSGSATVVALATLLVLAGGATVAFRRRA